MGRELQKRKRRSSRPAVRQPSSKPRRITNPLGNDIIAHNWDKDLTTTQNFRRLGLVARLNAPTGGVEPNLRSKKASGRSTKPTDPFAIATTGMKDGNLVTEAKVERDENGKIIRIISTNGKKAKPNPLNDPLNELETDSEAEAEEEDEDMEDDGQTWGGIEENEDGVRTDVVKALEAEANRPRHKHIRGQSEREREWLQDLIDKHGDNTRAMARDRKLNPMQQTEADLVRRIAKLKGEKA
ncbi:ribosome biogenesis protein Nop16 [Apiospora arundinis]|uniref:Nucleolar protein 16 n=1 Tax=Apiospora arundinis TaxID=335852 RepID=A0ABR2I0K9_9PEZI